MNQFHHIRGGDWAESSRTNAAAFPKPYKILTETDIKNLQESDISSVSAALSVPRGVACSLLFSNNWDLHSACDKWLSAAVNLPPQASTSKHVICNICFDKFQPSKMASAGCGHLFCLKCWSSYIGNSINDGAACLMLQCPEPNCRADVTSDMVGRFASDSEIEKCPAAGCDLAIEFEFGWSTIHDVVCFCSHTFCFLCAAESHRPVSCKVAAEWLKTKKSEAKSAKWIVSNTKPCPKCHRPIQKTQGCDHMTCGAPCLFYFCWNCLSPMKNHGDTCDRYTAEEKGKMKMPASGAGRYAHHRERWEFYENSGKAALGDLERARWRCGGGKMGFVAAAWEQIVECRRVLKWSYAFGYHVAEGELLEYLRGEAEAAVERLQRCAEEEMGDEGVYVDEEKFGLFEVKLLDLTRVTRKCIDDLVVASENFFTEVGSSKTSKRQRSTETRFEHENSKRHRYSESSDSDSSDSDPESSDSDSSGSGSDSESSESESSDSESESSDISSEDEKSRRYDSSSGRYGESKKRKYSTSEHEKSRRHNSSTRRYMESRRHKFLFNRLKSRIHNTSSTQKTGESSKYKKSRR
ncbi:probable E3 ubiquitin-protein ligase ARI5 [Salvia hispanica]|uniref:probable E3 ubiquitin-protein ligase ARI5 n=1 Tax=Salvia hispanica TaxID=49212 RepID=UPI002009BCC7|nr:probable E3 ubiquitin-protein ligase ARI5 [Salvia hispanica]